MRGEPDHVLVLRTLGAPQRRWLSGRRAKDAAPEPDPEPVPTGRATVIAAEPLPSTEAADRWLSDQRRDSDPEPALAVLNGVLAAQRIATRDPLLREARLADALVVRVGYGAGEAVAEGRWTAAIELPRRAARHRRVDALRPQERLAALLGGRDAPLACEELAMRAHLDFEQGRVRAAALGLRVALEAALAEVEDDVALRERVEDLRARRGAVGEAANAALRGELAPDLTAEVGETVRRLEALLRARAVERLG